MLQRQLFAGGVGSKQRKTIVFRMDEELYLTIRAQAADANKSMNRFLNEMAWATCGVATVASSESVEVG